jgi:GntR family transcriptional regulator, transcriptional repressor for pyruvate dehydrogenase complex
MARTGSDEIDHLRVQRIEPAYMQVAGQLRHMILEGVLRPGEQLPPEDKLGARFGVSRNTVREALRMLSSQNLVRTTRGVAGGTFVATPKAEVLQETIVTSLRLLNGTQEIPADELLEARLMLEVPSVRNAALRRTDDDLERMRVAAVRVEHGSTVLDRSVNSQDFHQAVLDAAGNRLLSLMAPPIWQAFTRNALAGSGTSAHWDEIDRDHLEILEHIEARRPDEAAAAMRRHLELLRAHD